jgi:hypothetical protein
MLRDRPPFGVIAGLDPAIHVESQQNPSVRLRHWHGLMDARVKPAHDAGAGGEA